jgi:NAD+ synthase
MKEKQRAIITELGVTPEIDARQEIEQRSQFLADYLARTGLNGFVLGISGGQDSLLAGILAQKAVEQRRKDGFDAEFHAVLLPYGAQADREDALLAIETIRPDKVHDFNIKNGVDGVARDFAAAEGRGISDYDKGNVKARMRMIAQYALASEYKLLVIGTDHAAEAVTGFFTKFGDGGADVLPLSGLTKRQGKTLLRELGAPEKFVTKKPTADLLDGNPGQADEFELGISYETLDDYLEGKEVASEVAEKIEKRYDATQHKRDLPVAFAG